VLATTLVSLAAFALSACGGRGATAMLPSTPSNDSAVTSAQSNAAPAGPEQLRMPETTTPCRAFPGSKYDPNTGTGLLTGANQAIVFPCFEDVTAYVGFPANHDKGASIGLETSSDKPLGAVEPASCDVGNTVEKCGEPLLYELFEPSKSLSFTAGASARIGEAFTSPSEIFSGYTYAVSVYLPKLKRTVEAAGGIVSSPDKPHTLVFALKLADGAFAATPTVVTVYRQKEPKGSVAYYDLPPKTPFSLLENIATGGDGNLWFADYNVGVGKITTAGKLTLYPVATHDVTSFISGGSDGNVWFSTQTRIGRITPAGQITQFDLPSKYAQPGQIAAGPDGNLWFPDNSGGTCVPNKIARITTRGEVGEFALPTACAAPAGMAAGADGNLWFGEQVGKIGRITTAGAIKEFTLRAGAHPAALTLGPDGNIWFTDEALPGVGRITPAGAVTEFSFGQGNKPVSIAAGPDGNIWATGGSNNDIFSVTTSGKVTPYFPPADGNNVAKPSGIVTGPDGNLWFTDLNNGVGRLTL
jgi:hypothetical protein